MGCRGVQLAVVMSQRPIDYQSPGAEERREMHPAIRWAVIVSVLTVVALAVWFILYTREVDKIVHYMLPG